MKKKYYYLSQQHYAGLLGMLKQRNLNSLEKAIRRISEQEVKTVSKSKQTHRNRKER